MAKIVAIGEVMAELSLGAERTASVGFAGDTFNTAVYLSRLGCETAYATVLGGEDPFTAAILGLMADEGVDTGLVARAAGRVPGLYAIERDENGERRFFYWRGEAPVREFAARADLDALQARTARADLAFLSAITLAVLGEAGREALVERLPAGKVGLDLNYRARLWAGPEAARDAIEAMAPLCRTISASAEDLEPLGLMDGPARWAAGGAEVVERTPDNTILVHRPGADPIRLPPGPTLKATDTTGAGDSFNAGYLAMRLNGGSIEEAVAAGRKLAGIVVQHRGAIIPRAAMP
jgi:2-dehydro-3-deoxygluconokinase